MSAIEAIEDWKGVDVVDPDGEKIGKLEEVWFRIGEDDPVLLSVKSGLLGRNHSLIPLDGATVARDYVRVRWSKSEVGEAPGAGDGGLVGPAELGRVGDHYGVDIDGPQDAELESGAERTERLRDADQALAHADELAAAAKNADEEATSAAERAEAAQREAADAAHRREEAQAAARDARAVADRKLALVHPAPSSEEDAGATSGSVAAGAPDSDAQRGPRPLDAPPSDPAERFDSPPPDAA